MHRIFCFSLPLLSFGCAADLDENCFRGPCGEEANQIQVTIVDTGDYPVDVFEVLDASCHSCHADPPKSGAPFSLLTVDDAESPYCSVNADDVCEPILNDPEDPESTVPRWSIMAEAVEPDAAKQMPFGVAPLPEPTLNVLRAWFASCEAGACERRSDEP